MLRLLCAFFMAADSAAADSWTDWHSADWLFAADWPFAAGCSTAGGLAAGGLAAGSSTAGSLADCMSCTRCSLSFFLSALCRITRTSRDHMRSKVQRVERSRSRSPARCESVVPLSFLCCAFRVSVRAERLNFALLQGRRPTARSRCLTWVQGWHSVERASGRAILPGMLTVTRYCLLTLSPPVFAA